MDYKNILAQSDAEILTITINREEKLNALNKETLDEIKTSFEAGFADAEIKGIILTGSGGKAFVAGADISEFQNITVEEGKAFAKNGQAIFDMIEKGPKPVIAAVNGFALGGGCELAMACHI